MPDTDNVADLIAQAYTYDLDMPMSLRRASLGAVAACYNGCGPDWLPEPVRNWLTGHFGYFAAAFLIHDWEFENEEDRSHQAFTRANDRLEANCERLKAKGVPWYKRWLYRGRPKLLAGACQLCGWGAWKDGEHPIDKRMRF